jgi:subtilisin family serine protease
MKHLCLILFSACFSFLHGQQTIMSAQTISAIHVIQADLHQNRSLPSNQVIDFYPIYKESGAYKIAVLCKINSSFQKAEAIRDGLEVGTIIGNVATIRMPLSRLTKDFFYPGIEYLEVAEKIAPELDGALIDSRVNLVHQGVDLPQPFTGKNVLLGVVDWGFDYTHPMFFDTSLSYTRILAAWDQVKVNGTPPDGFSHGALYTGADELALAAHDTVSPLTDYHGTHVAGIAGGSGGGTIYRGVGFESDLLFSQMRNDVTSAIDAFQWMYTISQEQGKRLVINNSWGNYRLHPLDGTSLMSQAIDAFTDLGVVFVFSAGNNGNINFHLKKDFAHDSVKTRIMGFDYTNDKSLWGQSVGMWGEPGHPFSAQLRILNNQNQLLAQSELFSTATTEPYLDTFIITGPDTIFYRVTTDASHPMNSRPQMTLDVRSKNQDLRKVLYAEATSGTVHFWNTRLTVYGIGNWGFGFTAPTTGYVSGDKNYGIGHPSVTGSVITAAAHETNFQIASFSSYGPRMDGMAKPDISAPGQDICSSFNSYSSTNILPVTTVNFNGRDYDFVRLSGTSMSAPMVSGVVALLLEANPNLTAHEVKEIIREHARQDALTGNIGPEGHVRWGQGKLDAMNVIQSIASTAITLPDSRSFFIYPNPAFDMVYSSLIPDGDESFQLLYIDGRLMRSETFNGAIDLQDIPDGMYFLNISNGSQTTTFKLVITH